MPTYKEAGRLVRRFEKAYPSTLPGRLLWWEKELGIDYDRFLRLIGLTPADIKAIQCSNWAEAIADQYEDRGWWLEGKLRELLSRYSYDWHKLAGDLHNSAWRRYSEDAYAGWLRDHPAAKISDEILLNRIISGGLESYTALLECLARSLERSAHS
jgi:hypothetical protein